MTDCLECSGTVLRDNVGDLTCVDCGDFLDRQDLESAWDDELFPVGVIDDEDIQLGG